MLQPVFPVFFFFWPDAYHFVSPIIIPKTSKSIIDITATIQPFFSAIEIRCVWYTRALIFPYQLRTEARGRKTGRDLWIDPAKTGLYQISPNLR